MKWLIPYPLLSALLLAIWLLLNQTLSLGHIVLGSAVALFGGRAFALLQAPRVRLRWCGELVKLPFVVLVDIVESNIAVGRIILGFGERDRTPGFVNIPLRLSDPYGLAALACIITATPGTLWVSFDSATRILQIHVLDLVDERQWVVKIQNRYERPLREIFE